MARDFEEQYGNLEDYLKLEYENQCYRCMLDFENSVFAINHPVCHFEMEQTGEIVNLGEFVKLQSCMSDDPRDITGFTCLSYIADDIFDCGTTCSQNRDENHVVLDMG